MLKPDIRMQEIWRKESKHVHFHLYQELVDIWSLKHILDLVSDKLSLCNFTVRKIGGKVKKVTDD